MKSIPTLLLLVWLISSHAVAKSFTLSSVEQDIYLQADGRVRVIDTRRYNFNGDYSKAYLTVDARGEVKFEGVQAVDGKSFSGSSVNGNTINWSYQASDEERTFRIIYTMSGELAVAQDAAQFDRQILEPAHVSVDNYTVRLHAPNGSPNPFKVFIFSRDARLGTLVFDDAKGIATVSLQNVAEDEWVRSVVLLPSAQFLNRTLENKQLDAWLATLKTQTADFRNASSQAITRGGFAPPPPPLPAWLLALPFLGAAFFGGNIWNTYQKYGREPSVPEVGKYYREPAENIPPSSVPYVQTIISPGSSSLGRAISATLMDFVRRGFLELKKGQSAGFLGIGKQQEIQFELAKRPQSGELSSFEEEIWNTLNRARGFDNIVTQSELSTYFRTNPSLSSSLSEMPRSWYEQQHGALLDTTDASKTTPWTIAAFIAGIVAFIGGFVFVTMEGATFYLGLALMASGMVTLLGGILSAVSLSRWNADKLLNAKRWGAYRNFLTDFSQMETAPAEHLKLWDYHFVYAIALGVAPQYLKNLRNLAERYPQYYHAPYWLPSSYYNPNNLSDLSQQLGAVNSLASLSSNLGSLESALASSGGTGGGFGGGGAGGSSGGGGSSGAS